MKQAGKSEFDRAQQAARFILAKTRLRPRIAVVLGSGLGAFADKLKDAVRISYRAIPHYPRSTAVGHAGKLVVGKVGGVALAAMQGRVHYYEGHSLKDVIFPMRVFHCMGVRTVILTCAAGGMSTSYGQGALVALSDHINLQGTNPLIGPNDARLGPRFHDMTDAYDPRLRRLAKAEARRLHVRLHEGIYAAVPGPSYETPAEIRFLRTVGADLVGMSTVPEAIAARHMGMRVLAIACVTNLAAGLSRSKISHEEVVETGRRVQKQLESLLAAIISRLADAK